MDDPGESLYLLSISIQPLTIGTAIGLLVVLVMVVCSALVSGAEVAYFSIDEKGREELQGDVNSTNHRILKLLEHPKRLLATILVSNNFINVGIVIVSAYVLEHLFEYHGNATLRFVVEVLTVTLILLIMGEVTPKIYATEKNLRLARLMALPLTVAERVFPINVISKFLVNATSVIDKRIKNRVEISVDDLSNALDLAEDIDQTDDEHKLLQGIITFGDTSVKQVMKSRLDVVAIEEKTSFLEVLSTIRGCGFSRIPVYRESFDHIMGVLYIKDLLRYVDKGDHFRWQKLIRSPFFVPEQKKLDDLLREFQQRKIHLAVVVDEYGGTSGIVTLEDVLEEIVGEITDEFDEEDLIYSKVDDKTYIFEGKTPLTDLSRILNVKMSEFEEKRGDSDSLAGFVIELAGKIPLKGERIKFNQFTFTIEAADKRRVKSIKVSIDEEEQQDEDI